MAKHETKVISAGLGAPLGGALAAYVTWQTGVMFFGASKDAGKAVDAVAAVPTPLAALLGFICVGGVAYLAGWLAPHTMRASADDGHADWIGVFIIAAVMIVLLAIAYVAGVPVSR